MLDQAYSIYGLTLKQLVPLAKSPATIRTTLWAEGRLYERAAFLHKDVKALISLLQPAEHHAMLKSLAR